MTEFRIDHWVAARATAACLQNPKATEAAWSAIRWVETLVPYVRLLTSQFHLLNSPEATATADAALKQSAEVLSLAEKVLAGVPPNVDGSRQTTPITGTGTGAGVSPANPAGPNATVDVLAAATTLADPAQDAATLAELMGGVDTDAGYGSGRADPYAAWGGNNQIGTETTATEPATLTGNSGQSVPAPAPPANATTASPAPVDTDSGYGSGVGSSAGLDGQTGNAASASSDAADADASDDIDIDM